MIKVSAVKLNLIDGVEYYAFHFINLYDATGICIFNDFLILCLLYDNSRYNNNNNNNKSVNNMPRHSPSTKGSHVKSD